MKIKLHNNNINCVNNTLNDLQVLFDYSGTINLYLISFNLSDYFGDFSQL